MNETLKITKFDCAERQLFTSIKLYFEDDDPVSTHTLACASHEVLQQIGRGKHHYMSVEETLIKTVTNSKKITEKEIINKLNSAQNFFKHAGRDLNETFEFNKSITEYVLFDACLIHETICGEMKSLIKMFIAWFLYKNPETMKEEHGLKPLIDGLLNGCKTVTKSEFWQMAKVVMENAQK